MARARGARGANLDYVANTAAHLAAAGMADAGLEAVLARARVLASGGVRVSRAPRPA